MPQNFSDLLLTSQWFEPSDFGNQSFPAISGNNFKTETDQIRVHPHYHLLAPLLKSQGKWPPKRAGDGKTTLR